MAILRQVFKTHSKPISRGKRVQPISLKHYDAIVVGAGIAGASTAYFLQKAGLSVLVLEKKRICSGGSHAAGAFLSPKISQPSPYKTYLNDAFLFSTQFYKEHFPDIFHPCGLEKIPLDEEDIKRCHAYEKHIEFAYTKNKEHYFFPDAGIIDPQKVCHGLLQQCDVKEDYLVDSITKDTLWQVDDFSATHLILAVGSDNLPFSLPYIKSKNIAGYRFDVRFDKMQQRKHNQHKDLSVSAFYNNCVAVGATHIKESDVTDLALQAEKDSFHLLEKAQKLVEMKNLQVLQNYYGYRNATYDYFPIVGNVIDEKETLKTYPYIAHGTKVPAAKYKLVQNLYIHGALGSRGFVYAPYNAQLLTALILKDQPIPQKLSPVRLFKKWATTHG